MARASQEAGRGSRGRWWKAGVGCLTACLLCFACLELSGICLPIVGSSWRGNALNNLHIVALGLIDYCDAHRGELPPAVVRDKAGKPLYSWRVLVLPYVEHQKLYEEFKLDEPWDSPHNLPLLEKMPPYFAGGRESDEKFLTPYQVFVGPGTAFERPGLRYPGDFTDDLASTFLVVEARDAVPWTKPVDLEYDPAKPVPALGGRFEGYTRLLGCWRSWQPCFLATFADGSWRRIPSSLDEQSLRALVTRNGGEAVNPRALE